MTWPHAHLLLPNLITLGRLLAVPVTVWLVLTDRMALAFWLFVAAGVSDALDGYIAKQFNAQTTIGRYLDPIADKALLVSVFISLGYQQYLAVWLVIMVVFRDALIVFGVTFSHILGHPVKLRPVFISKLNTVLQIILAGAVLADAGHGLDIPWLQNGLVYMVAISTFWSGAIYVVRWGREATEIEERPR